MESYCVIYCLDVDYQPARVTAACVGFAAWTDDVAALEIVTRTFEAPPDYEPGAFYKRELPYLTAILAHVSAIEAIVIDGYVWLGTDRPGLGKRLHDTVGAPVIGVAKTRFDGADAIEIVRGHSGHPLMITAVGIDPRTAAEQVRTMHGEHRMPTLVKRADSLARGHG